MTEKFDIERRARELMRPHLGGKDDERAAVQLARETAQAIAGEIDAYADQTVAPHVGSRCADIARRYAEPPKPETREERMLAAMERERAAWIKSRNDSHTTEMKCRMIGAVDACEAVIAAARRAMEEKP